MTDPAAVTRAARAIDRWVRLYTRDLLPHVAEDRRAEVLGDVRDQIEWSRSEAIPERRIARALGGRALRGAMSDVTWAMSEGRAREMPSPAFERILLAGVGILTVTLMSVGALGLIRTVTVGGPGALSVLVGVLIGVGALVLLVRPQTRGLATLWVIACAQVILFDGVDLVARTTTILAHVASASAGWHNGLVVADLGLSVMCFAAATWWGFDRPDHRLDGGSG